MDPISLNIADTVGVRAWNGRLLFSCLMVAASSILSGYDDKVVSAVAAMKPFVRDYQGPRLNISKEVLSARSQILVLSLPLVGSILGSLVASPLTDKFGRKRTLMACYAFSYLGIILQLSKSSLAMFVTGRLFNAAMIAICLPAAVQYLSEIVPAAYRGRVVSFVSFFSLSTGVAAALITNKTHTYPGKASYMIPLGAQAIMPTLLIPATIFIPESPMWLIAQGRSKEAMVNLTSLRGYGDDLVKLEIDRMKTDFEDDRDRHAGVRLSDLFRGHDIQRTLISGSVFSLNQISGIILSTTYATLFLTQLGVAEPFKLSIAAASAVWAGTTCGLLLVDHVGRRKLMIVGFTTIFVLDVVAGSLGFFRNRTAIKTIAGASFCLNFMWGLSFYPLSVVLPSEIPSLRLRSMTISYSVVCAYTTAVLTTFIVPQITAADGADLGAKTYLLFGGCMAVITVVYYLYLPETARLSFREIDQMYSQRLHPWDRIKRSSNDPSLVAVEERARSVDEGCRERRASQIHVD
ncbi:Sugar (and other) transporter-like protein 57 [Elsinoe fawcettii]|nr:Sugar (and other) transporter-like protein 57 [Elsinoe fawcettii]